jgi:hypothetical protein
MRPVVVVTTGDSLHALHAELGAGDDTKPSRVARAAASSGSGWPDARGTDDASDAPGPRALGRDRDRIGPLDAEAMAVVARRLDRLTKPPGSLGRLETLALELAGIRGEPVTSIARRRSPSSPATTGSPARASRRTRPRSPARWSRTSRRRARDQRPEPACRRGLVVVDVGVAGEPIETIQTSASAAAGFRLIAARVAPGTRDSRSSRP